MGISFKLIKKGDAVERWLNRVNKTNFIQDVLDECGELGLAALEQATPVRTGKTAASWKYGTKIGRDKSQLWWENDNVTKDGDPVVILLQMGHGTGSGGYVAGRDFINPAMKPVFDEISDRVWKAVTRL